MAQFDFLDNVKNTLLEQFGPETGRVNAELPPGLGETRPAPELGGLDSFLPPEEELGGGIPEPGGFPPPEAAQAPIGLASQITLDQLLGLGFNTLLEGLLNQPSPTESLGGINAAQGTEL